ncbi:hotdog fold domain-containing protein [Chitinolyticbacter albus]|uniref:hotdog fold domain-containing protein n=1 Tax=Chitinolyticbacter albus TaxID=2961951 RepID=UPI00210ACE74|nr:hotdog fold domain-containing protein [Chitinolyticbacter albus]
MANAIAAAWQRLNGLPAGRWLFSRLVCWKAPYFGSVRPCFVELKPGYAAVAMKKRRAVLNHIGTVHAIAMCNIAELAAGTMTDITIASTDRWIPKGMTVEYLKKADTDLVAHARAELPVDTDGAYALPVAVRVENLAGEVVLAATITMWVSPRKAG